MKVIYEPRAGGKTSKALDLFLKTENSVFVTFSVRERDRVRRKVFGAIDDFDKAQRKKKRVLNYTELGREKINKSEVIIMDNAEFILEKLIGNKIDVITLNKDDE